MSKIILFVYPDRHLAEVLREYREGREKGKVQSSATLDNLSWGIPREQLEERRVLGPEEFATALRDKYLIRYADMPHLRHQE